MLTCVICGEELLFEEDMKTHLLLSHLEDEMSCPLCSLSGVSYDDLTYHMNTAHPENHVQAQEPHRDNNVPSNPTSCPSSGTQATMITETKWMRNAFPATSFGGRTSSDKIRGPISTSGSACVTPDSSPTTRGCGGDERKTQGGQFPCPMCTLVCSTSPLLQEHVEVHLQVEDSAKGEGTRFLCPVCSVVCDDTPSLHEHVEEHFVELTRDSSALAPVSPGADLRLARKLQAEEDQRRRKEEAQLEAVEFKKLKEQFGLDGGGGYRRQLERRMEKAVAQGLMAPAEYHSKRAKVMEDLASGLDDGTTRTQGPCTLGALWEYYQRDPRGCAHIWLSAETDHYNSSEGDNGWGCGYRNLQMLLSALQRIPVFADRLTEGEIPSVPQLQRMIEGAWKEGLDPQGASHFNKRLQGTRAWIGATEIYALLTSLGLRARITDFHKHSGPGDTHPRMFEWVKQYFSQSSRGGRLPPRVVQTALPPLYLQHQGHSRSIVGVEERKNGSLCLLVLDPDCGVANAKKVLSADGLSAAMRHIRRFPSNMKHRQYQVVCVDQVLSPEEKQVCIRSSATLRVARIP
uniref:Zinc finger containing ubiquitin peptidase 1 n=1 Tax=Gadus morhua TaxID=8049 RepID=A0A8C4Z5A7_GADMO